MKVLLSAFMLVAIVGCSNNTATNEEAPDVQQEASQETLTTAEPVAGAVNITAYELLASYMEDEAASDQKYKGKTLVTTGVLDSVQVNSDDAPFVVLRVGNEVRFNLPQAHFDVAQADNLASLKRGET